MSVPSNGFHNGTPQPHRQLGKSLCQWGLEARLLIDESLFIILKHNFNWFTKLHSGIFLLMLHFFDSSPGSFPTVILLGQLGKCGCRHTGSISGKVRISAQLCSISDQLLNWTLFKRMTRSIEEWTKHLILYDLNSQYWQIKF